MGVRGADAAHLHSLEVSMKPIPKHSILSDAPDVEIVPVHESKLQFLIQQLVEVAHASLCRAQVRRRDDTDDIVRGRVRSNNREGAVRRVQSEKWVLK